MPPHTGNYVVFAASPAPGTVYEFHDVGTAMRDDDVDPSFASGPVEMTDDMHPAYREWAERNNPYLRWRERRQEEVLHDRLRQAGLPQDAIENPSPALLLLMKEMRAGWFALYCILDEHVASRPPFPRPSRDKRILAMACMACGHSPTAAARLLNVGSRRKGLDRNHVHRASKSFQNFFLGRSSREFELEFTRSWNLWLATERIRVRAAKHPWLKHYRGADLAHAIDEKAGLLRSLERELDFLGERGALMPYALPAA
ncbi:hypothetical protein Sa4125_39160 [Aureimonas sp. SA4125]|uniref:hypothetical protein n=1 Tax=Aureimonas sp. SA4125 TaxID=2826993 RepID=UPI001CC69366|nr:hypothetical protein [Aureimonas sp. SA4125]BDA86374.1 hypothetical protein Sa4125_39160 [Aureimonas sp. SA4125]